MLARFIVTRFSTAAAAASTAGRSLRRRPPPANSSNFPLLRAAVSRAMNYLFTVLWFTPTPNRSLTHTRATRVHMYRHGITRPVPFNRSRRLRKNRTALIGFLSLNIIIISCTYRVLRYVSCTMPPVHYRIGLLLCNIKFAKSDDVIAIRVCDDLDRFFKSPTPNMLVRLQTFLNGQIFTERQYIDTLVVLIVAFWCIWGSFFNHY